MNTEINKVEYTKALRSSEAYNALCGTLAKVCPGNNCHTHINMHNSHFLWIEWEFEGAYGMHSHEFEIATVEIAGKTEANILIFLIGQTFEMAKMIAQQEKPQ